MRPPTDVTWSLDGIAMHGTATIPDGEGPFPGVVMVAGSGPTDRNWNSPLLPGGNGSGRLLAHALAENGIASLRYDKRASGPHAAENLPAMIGQISMRFHLDELTAAVELLAGLPEIDSTKTLGLGNSEGCLHLLHYATSSAPVPLAGIVLAAPPGRSVGELLVAQLTQQLGQLPDADIQVALVEAATDRYAAGMGMEPDPRLPENVRMVLASFETPANLPFARELWTENATDTLPLVRVPTLVLIGKKDIQVDAHLDGGRLQAAARGMENVEFGFPDNANHVLAEELRPVAEILASGEPRYGDPDTHLDPQALELIMNWMHQVLADASGRH